MRLDKYLADMQCGTRSQVKAEIRKGFVAVNGETVRKADLQVLPGSDDVRFHGESVFYAEMEYYMLHKPAGCVSATTDAHYPTVMSYIFGKRSDLFPVGRLDLDTEGLLLITNDGALAHALLSPKKHIPKTYYAKTSGVVNSDDVRRFKEGIDIGDPKPAEPAMLQILSTDEAGASEIEVTVYEGRYHQVKRMFDAIGKPVKYLKRLSMGGLCLDPALKPGEYRPLTPKELQILAKKQ